MDTYPPVLDGGYNDFSSYIAAPTYAPPMHVTDIVHQPQVQPIGLGASYTPQLSAPYMPPTYGMPATYGTTSYSYQPPATYQPPPAGAFGQTYSYQPAVASYAPSYTPAVFEPYSTVSGYSSPMPMQGPPLSYVAPSTGSYVAPPSGPPPKLTEGIPDPQSVESQKQQYARSIEAQLKQEQTNLSQRNQAQKQMLQQQIEAQKAQYNLQMDQYLQQQAMAIDQQGNAEMIQLQEAAMQQKMVLEQQAAGLTLEYQQRKCQEEMLLREYKIQKEYYESGMRLMQQYQKQTASVARPGAPPGQPRIGSVAIPGMSMGGPHGLQPTNSLYLPTGHTSIPGHTSMAVPHGHSIHQPSIHQPVHPHAAHHGMV